MNHDSDIVVCGGQEAMSQAHHTIFMRQGVNGHHQLTDSVLHDVLTDAFGGILMGNTGNVCMQFTPSLHAKAVLRHTLYLDSFSQ
jgi:acetyl-CoA acetyltransferase